MVCIFDRYGLDKNEQVAALSDYLKTLDPSLIPIPVPANGNCLFAAVHSTASNSMRAKGPALKKLHENASALKRQVASEQLRRLTTHQANLFLPSKADAADDPTLTPYIWDSIVMLIQDKRWADELDLIPILRYWGIRLQIVKPKHTSDEWTSELVGPLKAGIKYTIVYNGINHFSATSEFDS